jgi:hypothetical protein
MGFRIKVGNGDQTIIQTQTPPAGCHAAKHDRKASLLCPITGHPCEGDLSYLCEDYGCARKGGLSPHSEENF